MAPKAPVIPRNMSGTSFDNPLTLMESPVQTTIPSVRERDTSENIRGRAQWEKHMKSLNLQRRYQKVSVFMVYWEKAGEREEAELAQQEVDRLAAVFRDKYHFTVREKKLICDSRRVPQVQIHHHLAEFVYDEDDDNTLMIIYYAGHGTPDYVTNALFLAPSRLADPEADEKSDAMDFLVWNEAERLIHSAQRADVFLILDCCHAGRMMQSKGAKPPWSERIFEFLGAAGPGQTTPLPGPESFTSALIIALEALAEEGERFTSSELSEKILEVAKFDKRKQLPCLSERSLHSQRRLILEPMPSADDLPQSPERDQVNEVADASKYQLTLQFLLPRVPTDKEYKNMCEGLKSLIRSQEFLAQQVLWKGLYPREHSSQMAAHLAAMKFKNMLLENRVRHLSESAPRGLNRVTPLPHGLPTPAPSEGTVEQGPDDLGTEEDGPAPPPSISPSPSITVTQSAAGQPSTSRAREAAKIAILATVGTVCLQGLRSPLLRYFVMLCAVIYVFFV